MERLFGGRLPEGAAVAAPLQGVYFDRVQVAKGAFMNELRGSDSIHLDADNPDFV